MQGISFYPKHHSNMVGSDRIV